MFLIPLNSLNFLGTPYQVDELVNDFVVSGRIPEPQFPKYFSVVINDSVAKSLNLVIDDSVRALSRKPDTR